MNPPLPPGWLLIDGYFIPPSLLDENSHNHPGRVICTNGKTIKTGTV